MTEKHRGTFMVFMIRRWQGTERLTHGMTLHTVFFWGTDCGQVGGSLVFHMQSKDRLRPGSSPSLRSFTHPEFLLLVSSRSRFDLMLFVLDFACCASAVLLQSFGRLGFPVFVYGVT